MTLKDYIQGKRHGKEANKLEHEAMNDPFLQDAIDGFDSVSGNHMDVIQDLEEQIFNQKKKKTYALRFVVTGIAASIAVLVGVSLFFHTEKEPQQIATVFQPDSTNQKDSIQSGNNAIAMNIDNPKSETKIIKKQQIKLTDEKPLARGISKNNIQPSNEETVISEDKDTMQPDELDKINITYGQVKKADLTGAVAGVRVSQKQDKETFIGKVLDENGDPLIGVSVKLKNNKYIGTITDLDGNFVLSSKKLDGNQLIASYVGYNDKIIDVKGDSTVIRLEPNSLALNEVVTIGYGRAKRASARTASPDKNSFGMQEFKKFVSNNLPDSLCNNQELKFKVTFKIDENGKPDDIKFVYSTCVELEMEFISIAQRSPAWTSNTNKRVTLLFNK